MRWKHGEHMRKLETPLWIAIVGALALSGAPVASADEFPLPQVSYSADVAMKATADGPGGGSFQSTGRIYFADGKTRREMTVMGRETVVIERPDKGVRWSLLPGMGMVAEYPIDRAQPDGPPDPASSWREDVTLEKRGREEVNGVQADRYEVKAKGGGGDAWLTEQKVPVRYQGSFREGGRTSTMRMDFTNIQVGPQDAALFELPDGVTPMPAAPLSTHGPGSNRQEMLERMRQQAEEMRKRYGK